MAHHHRYEPPREADPWEALDGIQKTTDTVTCNAWKDEIEKLLLLAGLACAVVTPFAIESYRELKDDPQEISVHLLSEILNVMIEIHTPRNLTGEVAPSSPSFLTGSAAVRVNVFWFLSITLNLCTVFVGIVCLQWIREYTFRDDSMPAKEAVALRQMRYEGLVYWKVSTIVAALPLFLQSSLILFFFGLVEFLWALNQVVATAITLFICPMCLFFLSTTTLPGLQILFPSNAYLWIPQCPYKSSQSWLFYKLSSFSFSLLPSLHALLQQRCGCQTSKSFLARLQGMKEWIDYDLLWRDSRDGVPWSRGGTILGPDQQDSQRKDGVDTAHALESLIRNQKGYQTYSIIHHCLQNLEPSTAVQVLQSFSGDADTPFSRGIHGAKRRDLISFQVLDLVFQRDERIRSVLLPFRLELFLELVKEPSLAPHIIPMVDFNDIRSDRALSLEMRIDILGYLAQRLRSADSAYALSSEMEIGLLILSSLDIKAIRGTWETFKPFADFALAFFLWSKEHPSLSALITVKHNHFKPHLIMYELFCGSHSSRNVVYSLELCADASRLSSDAFELASYFINTLELRELQHLAHVIASEKDGGLLPYFGNLTPTICRSIIFAEFAHHLTSIAPGLRSYFLLQVELFVYMFRRVGAVDMCWPIRSDEDLRFLLSYGSTQLLQGLLDALMFEMQHGSLLEVEWNTLLFCVRILNPSLGISNPNRECASFVGAHTFLQTVLLWPSKILSSGNYHLVDNVESPSLVPIRSRMLTLLQESAWPQHFPTAEILEELQSRESKGDVLDLFSSLFDNFDLKALAVLFDTLYLPPEGNSLSQPRVDSQCNSNGILTSLAILISAWTENMPFPFKFQGAANVLFPHRLRMYLHIMSIIPGVYFRKILEYPWQNGNIIIETACRTIEISEDLVEVVLASTLWAVSTTDPSSVVPGLLMSTKDRRNREFAWCLIYYALQRRRTPQILQASLEWLRTFSTAIRKAIKDTNGSNFPCDVLHVRFLLKFFRSKDEKHIELCGSGEMRELLQLMQRATIMSDLGKELVEWDVVLKKGGVGCDSDNLMGEMGRLTVVP